MLKGKRKRGKREVRRSRGGKRQEQEYKGKRQKHNVKRREEKKKREELKHKSERGKRKEKREERREARESFFGPKFVFSPKVGNYFSSLLLGPQNILAHSCQSIFFGSIYLRPPVFPAQSRN